MKKNLLFIVGVACLALLFAGYSSYVKPVPSITVGYDSVSKDRSVVIEGWTTSSGERITSGPTITPGYRNGVWPGAKFSSAFSDEDELPDWIEFEWKEWYEPYPERPNDPEGQEEWSRTFKEYDSTVPIKRLRVQVRSRVPQEVIDEALASAIIAKPGELPEKRIWISFVWHPNGIWFVWRISTETQTLRRGGDEIPWQPE